VSPRVTPKQRPESSYAEYRSLARTGGSSSLRTSADIVWKYLTAPANLEDARLILDAPERRVLSKASSAAGGYLVPTDFYEQLIAVVRARGSIARLAREIVTAGGTALQVPLDTVHGVATWTAENVGYTASDETFGQVTLNAFKAATKVIVSEELAADPGIEFDAFLALELGQRIAALEAAAFATGDGTGKPLGAVANTGATVTMPTGNTVTFAYDSLVDALHTVAPGYREPEQQPAWVGSDGALKALRKLKDTANQPVLFPNLIPGGPPVLLGYPFYVDENLAAPAANAKSLVFAGWQAFYAIRRVGEVGLQRQTELAGVVCNEAEPDSACLPLAPAGSSRYALA
jgi:HK97 family phage major capsid protein